MTPNPSVLDPAVIDTLQKLAVPGEPDLLREVLTMFMNDVPQRMEKLRNAHAAGNIQDVRRSAHSLKGSSGNIGARAMFDICKRLDAGEDLAAAGPLIDELGVEFGKVEEEIRRLMAS